MIFRPDPWKVGFSGGFLLAAGLVAALAEGVPLLGRAVGWILILLVPTGLCVIVKTSLAIRGHIVEVGRLFGRRTFQAGQSSATLVAVPGGLRRDGKAIRLRGDDGQTAMVNLNIFARRKRARIIAAVRETLEP
jgi:hypothetical protein